MATAVKPTPAVNRLRICDSAGAERFDVVEGDENVHLRYSVAPRAAVWEVWPSSIIKDRAVSRVFGTSYVPINGLY